MGALLGVIPDGVIVGDVSTGRVVSWNRAAASLFGYPVEDGPGLLITDLMAPSHRRDHEAGLARVRTGHPTPLLDSNAPVELEARQRNGEPLWIELRLARLPEVAEADQVVAVVRDVSARRQADALVGERLAELVELHGALSEFLSTVAHDLRGPVWAMRAAAQLMFENPLAPDRQEELLGVVSRQAGLAVGLLDELEQAADLDRGEVTADPEVVRVADAVAAAARAAAVSPETLTVDVGRLSVRVDRSHVVRMLANFLSNALRFGAPPYAVTARALAERVVITVADHGEGVHRDLEERLFTKFTRAASAQSTPGLGLGLAIVARLAEANGGAAYYEPGPDGGSWFCLELPAAPSHRHPSMTGGAPRPARDEEAAEATADDIERTSTRAVVVVADDSSDQRRLLSRELRQAGYEVLEAADGIDALNLADQADLVVLDVHMPGLSGFEVMTEMHARPDTEGVPVILLSRHILPSLPARAMTLGAVDYLDLPAATGELAARVQSALRSSRLAVELRRRNQELDHLSRTDALTGVWNRRHAEEALELATATSRRLEKPVSVLMVDVDHFKAVNDELGHRAGDKVLAHIAGLLKEHLRAGDTLGRWGGEEFLIICPDTDLPDAVGLGERLRQAVADAGRDPSEPDARATISIGVAAEVGPQPLPLVETADRALRTAKGAGRNRVEPA